MDQQRVNQAQQEYRELLQLAIVYEETVLNDIKNPEIDEFSGTREALKEKMKKQEENFMKKYSDLILQGVTFQRDINTYSNQSL
jgi:hypothetical protein